MLHHISEDQLIKFNLVCLNIKKTFRDLPNNHLADKIQVTKVKRLSLLLNADHRHTNFHEKGQKE